MLVVRLYFILSAILFICFSNSEINPGREKAKSAIFFLGDSVSEKIYNQGLIDILKCNRTDPNIKVLVEANNRTGLMCFPNAYRGLYRIGYMRHWGVGRDDGDYYRSWEKMTKDVHTDTNNSVSNILAAVEEFKQRSESDRDVTFILLSNLWDNHRYKIKYSHLPLDFWLLQYKYNYTALVGEIMVRLRPGKDKLVLQTQHSVKPDHVTADTIIPMNQIVKSIAGFYNLPIFDEYEILKNYTRNFTSSYLQDDIHQNNRYSLLIAQHIISKNWILPSLCPIV